MPSLTPRRIFLTGLLVGTLDITAACTQAYLRKGITPGQVLRFVASGLFKEKAKTGGSEMVATGLLIHYCIAMTFTLFFVLLIKNIAALRVNRLITGLLYGAFVWAVMNKIVLPLISTPSPQTLSLNLQAMGILIVCIGLPLAFLLIPKQTSLAY